MSKLVIAISGMNATDNPGPGVGVARSLRQSSFADVRMVGLCYGSLEPGAYMKDIVDVSYLLPFPSEGMWTFLDRLRYIQEREHVDIIIPNLDSELFIYIKIRSKLEDMGIHVCLPTIDQFDSRQKYRLADFGAKMGFNVPKSVRCNTVEDLISSEVDLRYPIMMKGNFYEAYYAGYREQAVTYFWNLMAKWGAPVIAQQYIPGAEFNVVGAGDGKGNLLSCVPMHKQFLTDKGKAWAGVTIKDDQLMDLARRFVETTCWMGAFELELLRGDDNVLYLIEINPRMPAWVYLATAAGENIPEQVAQLALGETPAASTHYEVGKMFIRYSWDMVVNQSEFGQFSVKGEM
jgi:carbamoyl-phosphate synthase large subunit